MKPGASRIERMLAKIEATLVPPRRKWLRVIVEGDDEVAEAKKKERCSPSMWPAILKTPRCTVEDFNWIELTLVRPRSRNGWLGSEPGPAPSGTRCSRTSFMDGKLDDGQFRHMSSARRWRRHASAS